MSFVIKSSALFVKQVSMLPLEARQLIKKKIAALTENPFRNKKIPSKQFSKVYRIRISVAHKDIRLIYIVIEPNVVLVCLLNRGDNYTDLEKYLRKLK